MEAEPVSETLFFFKEKHWTMDIVQKQDSLIKEITKKKF
jgi:hypothetical protein